MRFTRVKSYFTRAGSRFTCVKSYCTRVVSCYLVLSRLVPVLLLVQFSRLDHGSYGQPCACYCLKSFDFMVQIGTAGKSGCCLVVYLRLEGVIVSRNLLCDIKELFFYSFTYQINKYIFQE